MRMNLTRVSLREPTWDPAKPWTNPGDRGVQRTEFATADGYTLELDGPLLCIAHGGTVNVIGSDTIASSAGRIVNSTSPANLTSDVAVRARDIHPPPASGHPQAELPRPAPARCTHEGIGLPGCNTCDPRTIREGGPRLNPQAELPRKRGGK